MGKYKKWKRLVSVSTAACMAITAASLTGCSGGDSGSSQSVMKMQKKRTHLVPGSQRQWDAI